MERENEMTELKFEDIKVGDELVYDDAWDYVVVEIIDSVLIVRRKTSDGWQGNSFDQGAINLLALKPQSIERWLNVYPDGRWLLSLYETKEEANKYAAAERTACIKVSYFDGEGL